MKYIFKKRKALIFSILILIGFFMSFSVVFGAGLSWFGGKITTVTTCTCSEGSQATITGFPWIFSGTYLYLPGITQVKKGSVAPNKQILGKYSSGGACMVGVLPNCTSLPISKGTMKLIGTN